MPLRYLLNELIATAEVILHDLKREVCCVIGRVVMGFCWQNYLHQPLNSDGFLWFCDMHFIGLSVSLGIDAKESLNQLVGRIVGI